MATRGQDASSLGDRADAQRMGESGLRAAGIHRSEARVIRLIGPGAADILAHAARRRDEQSLNFT
jgi:hypothetical protein